MIGQKLAAIVTPYLHQECGDCLVSSFVIFCIREPGDFFTHRVICPHCVDYFVLIHSPKLGCIDAQLSSLRKLSYSLQSAPPIERLMRASY